MNNPPGNYYDNQPAKSGSGGCWKAAGITCAVLLVLGIVAVVIGVNAVKTAMHDKKGIFGQAMSLGTTIASGTRIQQGIVKYHSKNGKYPATLTDLVADGEIDGKILHSDLDPDPNPGHVSWTYTKPAEDAPGSTRILKLHYHLNIPGARNQQSQDSDVLINLDGSQTSGNGYSSHYGTS